jgi:hypothetical protein
MTETLPTMYQINHENRFPNCLRIQLEGILGESEQIDLPVEIEFNEQWESLGSGRVKFGLKGGILRLNLENAQIPDNLLNLTGLKELQETPATENFQLPSMCQITMNNSELNLAWVFELKMIGSQVLKGVLPQEKLGTLTVNDRPCYVEATFEVILRYVHITDVEGLWPANIARNKQIVLERKIAEYLWKSQLQPYLSRSELRYD